VVGPAKMMPAPVPVSKALMYRYTENFATAGTADSFLRASHVLRTRRAHQVTAAALYILQHRAYNHYCLGETRDAEDLPQFTGVAREEKTSPSFTTGQPCWN